MHRCRGMLAERLLAKSDYDTDAEIRTLEHLKKRFGEANLHSCEASSFKKWCLCRAISLLPYILA